MKKSKIVLSFDDGRKDNYDVAVPIIKKYELTATFNIATAFVDGSISQIDLPCANKAMSIDNVCELSSEGFEIACHGDCHKNNMDDIIMGKKKLAQWVGWRENYRPGFASPQSNLTLSEIKNNLSEFKGLFSYIRIAAYSRDTAINRVGRKIAHITHNRKLYNVVFHNNIGGIKDGFIASSIPIVNIATVEQVESVIRSAAIKQEDCILMFHSIIPHGEAFYENLWSWDVDKFDMLCKWLWNERTNGRLDVVRTIDLI